MEKVKIQIVRLGGFKYQLDENKIKKWKTSFFEISDIVVKDLPDSSTKDIWYSNNQIKKIIGDTSKFQIVFALIDHPLAENSYVRPINKNCIVFSLYEMADILLKNDFQLELYIIRNLYLIAGIYYRRNNLNPTNYSGLIHQDIRGCLFDKNNNRENINYYVRKISICDKCRADFREEFLSTDFLKNISKELNNIKRTQYFILRDFIKRRPILSIFVGAISTLAINFLAGYLFYYFFN
jgi:hypothetical protein